MGDRYLEKIIVRNPDEATKNAAACTLVNLANRPDGLPKGTEKEQEIFRAEVLELWDMLGVRKTLVEEEV